MLVGGLVDLLDDVAEIPHHPAGVAGKQGHLVIAVDINLPAKVALRGSRKDLGQHPHLRLEGFLGGDDARLELAFALIGLDAVGDHVPRDERTDKAPLRIAEGRDVEVEGFRSKRRALVRRQGGWIGQRLPARVFAEDVDPLADQLIHRTGEKMLKLAEALLGGRIHVGDLEIWIGLNQPDRRVLDDFREPHLRILIAGDPAGDADGRQDDAQSGEAEEKEAEVPQTLDGSHHLGLLDL